MDDSGRARIAGFSHTTVTRNMDSMRSASDRFGYFPRWPAPEGLRDGESSKEGDIFSFAMVMIEVCDGRSTARGTFGLPSFCTIQAFTGEVPFENISSFMVMLSVVQGERPPRPTHPIITDDLWTLIQRCWDQDPRLRPDASEVLRALLTPSSDLGRVAEMDADDQPKEAASDPCIFSSLHLGFGSNSWHSRPVGST